MIALLALTALAQTTGQGPSVDLAEEADLQFDLGVEAARAGDCRTALEHLLASNRLVPNKNVVYNVARCYAKLGDFDQAYRHYADYLAVESDPDLRASAERAVADIRSQVALLHIETDPPGATIYIDRTDLGPRGPAPRVLALTPGPHTIIAELDGYESARQADVPLVVGATTEADLALVPILGTVDLTGSPPGAEVRIDDKPEVVARLPGSLALFPGPHVLSVTAPGYRPTTQVVTVTARKSTRAAVDLDLVTGTVVVNASERDALITVDGTAQGFTPAVLDQISAGEHDLVVTLRGYRPYEQHIVVPPDGQITVAAPLRSLQEVTAASRTAESVDDAPASVSLISAQEIRAFGYETLYDALGGTRGIYQSNDLTYQYIGVRGFSRAGDYGNRVLVTIDGHTMNDDQLGASYVGYDLYPDLKNLDRVEVVRGPGSALYGTNAFFGVVNLVTHDADTTPGPWVSIGANGGRTARVSAGIGKGGESGGWLSAAGAVGQGSTYDFPDYREAAHVEGADGMNAMGAQGRAWSGDFTLQGSFDRRDKRIPSGAYETTLGDPRAHSVDTRAFLEARYEPALGAKSQLYSRAYVDHYAFRGDYPYDPDTDDWIRDTWNGTWAGVEGRVVASPVDPVRITAGLEGRSSLAAKLHGDEFLGDDPEPIDTYLDENPVQQVASGYAVADLSPIEPLSISVGARADWFSSFGFTVNPRAAIVAHPSERDTIKLLGGTAFRAPSPYERTYQDGGFTQVPAPDLDPERIRSAELEGSHRFGEVTSLVVSAYYNDIDDLIALGENADGLNQYANTDESVSTVGAEAEVRRDWRQGWMLAANAGYQRGRRGDPIDGQKLANSPAWLGSVKAAAPLPGSGNATTRLRYESGRAGAGQTSGSVVLWDVTLTGDLGAGRIAWALGVKNLLDWDVAYPGGGDLLQREVPQPGRTAYAEITVAL